MRALNDATFLTGVAGLAWFVLGLKTGWSYARTAPETSRGAGRAIPKRTLEPAAHEPAGAIS
jgi:hypothetical protein